MKQLTIEAWPPVDGVVKIHKGATFDPVMVWRDSDGPIDWTGYSGSMVMQFSNAVTVTLSTINGGMLMGSEGTISFLLADTSIVPLELGYFAISVMDTSLKTRILARGRVEVD
jgi:hypothetical protein